METDPNPGSPWFFFYKSQTGGWSRRDVYTLYWGRGGGGDWKRTGFRAPTEAGKSKMVYKHWTIFFNFLVLIIVKEEEEEEKEQTIAAQDARTIIKMEVVIYIIVDCGGSQCHCWGSHLYHYGGRHLYHYGGTHLYHDGGSHIYHYGGSLMSIMEV